MVGGAKVLGKHSVPGRATKLDDSRARAYCAWDRCGWGLTGGFHLLQNFSVAISVSPHVCFILVLILISVFVR